MKIVGISNPSFFGVSVATRAVCHEWLQVDVIQQMHQVDALVKQVKALKPDLLIIGGWSYGYTDFLRALNRVRTFPVMSVYHSTPFHGAIFADEIFWQEMEDAHSHGITDVMAFVQPQTSRYYCEVKKVPVVWLPHCFPLQPQVYRRPVFKIGAFGGLSNVMKNSFGAAMVAREFARTHKGVTVAAPMMYDKPHEEFLTELGSCSLVIHLSHLECYSNTVQEAWARGIPVITSPANNGLTTKNPLQTLPDCVRGLILQSGIDAGELHGAIDEVHRHWQFHADETYQMYSRLYAKTKDYQRTVFKHVVDGYKRQKYDDVLFNAATLSTTLTSKDSRQIEV